MKVYYSSKTLKSGEVAHYFHGVGLTAAFDFTPNVKFLQDKDNMQKFYSAKKILTQEGYHSVVLTLVDHLMPIEGEALEVIKEVL